MCVSSDIARSQVAEGDKVLIAYEDGAPLLIERTLGAGRMLVLTAPIDRDWNDLAIHPLFVRFIAEAARYLIAADASAASTTVGSVVMTGLTAAGGGQIFDPQGERVLGLAQTRGRGSPDSRPDGFYEIRGNEGVRWLAVNVDARESDLTPLPRVLRAALAGAAGAAAAPRTSQQLRPRRRMREPRSLGPAAAVARRSLAAGGAVAGESLPGRSAGRRRNDRT